MKTFDSEDIVERSRSSKCRLNPSNRVIKGIIASLVVSCIVIGVIVGTNSNQEISDSEIWKITKGLESPYRYDCDEISCTPLDDYVWRNNDDFTYNETIVYGSLVGLRPVKTFVMNMTSQNWLTENEVSRTLWYHEVVISLPKVIDPAFSKSCVMLIDGGSNRPGNIMGEDSAAVVGSKLVANSINGCVAILRQVPNQSLYFKNDPRKGESGRKEDDIIAWTWKHFIKYPNQPDWLLRLPMTKAARLAMDLVNEKIQFEKNLATSSGRNWKNQFADVVDEFTIMGASKRGWTTWTIASVDKRVKAAIPMVLDCLNMKQIFSDWYQNNGAWSFALEPYFSENLTNYFDDPVFDKMASIIDPYSYRDRLTMPKMVISSTGDEFFAPDDSYAYFDGLPEGTTYLRLLPNAEHSMIPPQGLSSPSIAHGIRSFYMAVQKKFKLPELKWIKKVDKEGYASVTVFTDRPASLVNGWTADTLNTTRRDFRWAKLKNNAVDWPTNQETTKFTSNLVEDTSEYLWKIFDEEYNRDIKLEKEILKNVERGDVQPEDIEFQPIKWNQIRVENVIGYNGTAWRTEVPPSHAGFRALMIELSFAGPDDRSKLTFTTEVMITPEKRPFEKCHGEGCYGYLI